MNVFRGVGGGGGNGSAQIKRKFTGSVSVANNGTTNVTLPSDVDMSKITITGIVDINLNNAYAHYLISGQNVAFRSSSIAYTIYYEIIEWINIKSIQRGFRNSTASGFINITGIDLDKSFLLATANGPDMFIGACVFTSNTQIKYNAGSESGDRYTSIFWNVVESN